MTPAHSGFGRNYGRSLVISQQGIVATSHALASQAGAQILANGGSAVDAAIAANAVLGVVEPMMDGIGGDLFVLYWDAEAKELSGLNASGPAPCGLSPAFLAGRGETTMPPAGIHAVTVPGAVDGWAQLHKRFGNLPWDRLFASAIAYADQGFPVTEVIEEQWTSPISFERLLSHPESSRVFLPGGKPPSVGELFRNPDLAAAYSSLASAGSRTFYEGELAAAILKTSKSLGGTMNAEDLSGFSAEWVEPISIDYRGWRVYELPPNGQGMAALEMLNIMETSPAAGEGPSNAAELHKRIEAMKLSYSDVWRYNGDPRHSKIPVATLLSKEHARERAAMIDPRRANGQVPHAQINTSDTTYLTVVDRAGNIASWIQSVYSNFGSGITVEGMGFALQNRGAGFTLDPAHPNVLAGGKRPYHTIIPGFMQRGSASIGFGIMGGPNQPLAHAQFVSNVVDYGMNLQQALETPRFTKFAPSGCDLLIESRVPSGVVGQLTEMGHEVAVRREYTQEMGRGQAILHDSETGTNYAASDPRADGAAAPEPIVV
jgi:gamma-glutamyltranspeptidase / glutathione hydrolase